MTYTLDKKNNNRNKWEKNLVKFIQSFNDETEHIIVGVETQRDFKNMKQALLNDDKALIIYAIIIILTYVSIFLGSCSPIHCRLGITVLGLCTIYLSTISGFGLCFMLGVQSSDVTQTLPLLMLGVGVDDMFVICNALD